MDLNGLESILLGLMSGFFEMVPVSAQVHRLLMLKFAGIQSSLPLQDLLIHIGILLALYISCQKQLLRMSRAKALSHVPPKKRRRPLDVQSLMDWRLLRTMLIPVIVMLFFYRYTRKWNQNPLWLAGFLVINGGILFLPQFFPTGNRDSRTLSRVEGLLMGLGGSAAILPGISAVGTAASVGSICGIDRRYALDMAVLMNLFFTVGWIVYDVMALAGGIGDVTVWLVVKGLLTMGAAFGGTLLGVRLMRYLAKEHGYTIFAFYCWGIALFTFILNLMA